MKDFKKKNIRKIKLRQLRMMILATIILYSFISFINWEFDIANWSGSSQFIFVIIEAFIIMVISESHLYKL